MTEAKHTPGPWKAAAGNAVKAGNKNICSHVNAASRTSVSMMEDVQIAKANARLIAAAPDQHEALLEAEAALECALDRLKSAKPEDYAFHATSEYKALEVVRAAIAKATE